MDWCVSPGTYHRRVPPAGGDWGRGNTATKPEWGVNKYRQIRVEEPWEEPEQLGVRVRVRVVRLTTWKGKQQGYSSVTLIFTLHDCGGTHCMLHSFSPEFFWSWWGSGHPVRKCWVSVGLIVWFQPIVFMQKIQQLIVIVISDSWCTFSISTCCVLQHVQNVLAGDPDGLSYARARARARARACARVPVQSVALRMGSPSPRSLFPKLPSPPFYPSVSCALCKTEGSRRTSWKREG